MAEVFKRVKGQKIERIIARVAVVQSALKVEAVNAAQRAEVLLDTRSKVRTGTSTIDVEKGDIDYYVVLDDTRGFGAAMSIEYGRQAELARDGAGHFTVEQATEGLFVLHDATGLPH